MMNVDVQLLGQYDFDNFTLLNALMSEEDRINTAIHEYTHFVLSNQSVYGTIQYCLKKLTISLTCNNDINKMKSAIDFFANHTIKVQEGLAVFIEATYFMLSDTLEYEKFINNLRSNNKLYYGYVKPLCFILEYMKDSDNNSKIAIAHAVFQLALKSMNSSIYDYDGKLFATSKSIKKLVSRQDFSKEYLPNKSFFAMIEECKKEETYEKFSQKLFSLAKSEEDDSVDFYRDRLVKIKDFVLGIFESSPNIEIYKNRMAQVEINEVDSSSVFLQQIPTAFNEDYVKRNMKKIGYELLKMKCKSIEYSTLFLLGGLQKNIVDLFNKMGVIDFVREDEVREIVFFYSLRDKEIFGCLLEKTELQELLVQNDNKCVLLTSYKNYDYENNRLLDYSTTTENMYIYCDRTYANTLQYINLWDNRKVFYRYMVYKSMIVLLIKINENTLFLLPMTPMVADEADKDIRDNHKNMRPITEVEDEEYDPYIIKDEKVRNEIDTIINCLFFINLPVPDVKQNP